MRYLIDVHAEIDIENLQVSIPDDGLFSEQCLQDAAIDMLNKRLTILDIKGARSGDDGFISDIGPVDVSNWNRQD